jgi:hypothetical protein
MSLIEYINTKNYRERINAMLNSQRQKLTPKQFDQFASSYLSEIKRLDGQLAEFEEVTTFCSGVYGGLSSRWTNRAFWRLIPGQARPQVNVAFTGFLGSPRFGSHEFTTLGQFVSSEGWNSPIQNPCDCVAA